MPLRCKLPDSSALDLLANLPKTDGGITGVFYLIFHLQELTSVHYNAKVKYNFNRNYYPLIYTRLSLTHLKSLIN